MRWRWILTVLVSGTPLLACSAGGADQGSAGSSSGAGTSGTSGTSGTAGTSGTSGSSGNAGSGGLINIPGEDLTNPCESADAPPECEAVPSGPACGDGEINQASEACDDGNSLPGDGCSGVCVLEAYHECPTPGQPCVSTIVCGDGTVGPGEACDDGDAAGGDGCSATCNLVEQGYACRTPGQACIRVYICGDGSVDPNEGCDDGDRDDGDGCSSRCRLELGFKCSGSPSACTPTTCGDRVVEGAESCDDGNSTPFDGCSGTCRAEPTCGSSGACASSCGDGIVLDEDCDDGNLRDGDGCSSDCTVEDGFVCDDDVPCELRPNAEGVDTCTMTVSAVFRDFNASNSPGGHPDFQPGTNSNGQQGLVAGTLDADRKPTFTGQDGGNIQSQATFAQWYRSVQGVNATVVGSIVLWEGQNGAFVNRWGPNGEQWLSYNNPDVPGPQWCANGNACGSGTACVPTGDQVCVYPCPYNNNNTDSCLATPTYVDGSPAFFPVDPPTPGILNDTRSVATIPQPVYFGNWAEEPGRPMHNFHFTTEVKYWFRYDSTATATLAFTGDDDVWVFVNRRLALDLGGWHPPLTDEVTINAASAASFGLTNGGVYEIAVFQAERQTSSSSFRLTLSGFTLAPSDCHTNCGDGEIGLGEECDDGSANDGAYNHCSPSCTLGPRCGDAIRQDQFGEACDDGVNNGSYGGCAPDCQLGPHCGDGVVTDQEQCDDGVNDGGYGECYSGCVLGSYCGDGQITVGFEECDDNNNVDKDGCSAACKKEIAVTE